MTGSQSHTSYSTNTSLQKISKLEKNLPTDDTEYKAARCLVAAFPTSVVRLWRPRANPTNSINFTGRVFHEEETCGTLIVRLSLHRWGRTSAAGRARQSANGRQLRVGGRQTNKWTDRQTNGQHHRVKPAFCGGDLINTSPLIVIFHTSKFFPVYRIAPAAAVWQSF